MNITTKSASLGCQDPENSNSHSSSPLKQDDEPSEEGDLNRETSQEQSDASSQQQSLTPEKQILLTNLGKQNKMLKQKVYELEMQQRKNMSKIIELEMNAVKSSAQISEILRSAQNVSILSSIKDKQNRNKSMKSIEDKQKKEERKFIEAIKGNYKALFGIESLKEIWKKHKQILEEWVLHQN